MNLHRAFGNEWDKIPPNERNNQQKLAAATLGVATIANAISIGGGYLSFKGLDQIDKGYYNRGFVLLSLGLTSDFFDGSIAHATGTKSQLGEAIDAGKDKLVVRKALPILVRHAIMPKDTASAFEKQGIANAAIAVTAKVKGVELHPSLTGKLTSMTQAMTIGGYCASFVLRESEQEDRADKFLAIAQAAEHVALKVGPIATLGYAKQLGRSS